ncbi:ABC transporter ATP-binding protein [Phytopseudomonas dryadis]
MLGPSGSGKTTCLRLIAGFEQPTAGSIRIHGTEAAGLPPYLRDVNTVFQDYALFPHMTVRENVAYGLKVKGVASAERKKRAEEALQLVALGGYGDRKPVQLSGGQRQRVALARALVNRPRVLLLDEPLGALDLKLREQMQGELKRLQRQLNITFIFVTHDQTEALSMSDRVAVFNNGRIEQVDSPRDLYMKPKTAFVAEFVGTSNVLRGDIGKRLSGTTAPFSIRPEHIQFSRGRVGDEEVQVTGILHDVQYQGSSTRYELKLDDTSIISVSRPNTDIHEQCLDVRLGESLAVKWSRHAMTALQAEG